VSHRVGIGFDAHRLVEGRGLVLGGVRIEHDRGLAGHSDGDVLLHALCDAILGAAGAPDLGSLFPSSDPRWRGTPSTLFLEDCARRVRARGFRLIQMDAVVIAERPQLAPYVDAIRTRLAGILRLPATAVGVKFKSCNGLGFTGRGEGIAAQAVALLSPRRKRRRTARGASSPRSSTRRSSTGR
jgi:2-C-methyl-D-erythritol 2,4-cyclodiphosphate synthase